VQAFTTKNPGTSISTEFAPFDDCWDKLATQTAGGNGPDVFRMSMSCSTQSADRGALLDLSDAVPEAIDTGSLVEVVASSGEVDGTLFGIGQSSTTHASFVDTAAILNLGATVPQTAAATCRSSRSSPGRTVRASSATTGSWPAVRTCRGMAGDVGRAESRRRCCPST